jgi:hypothetical protein
MNPRLQGALIAGLGFIMIVMGIALTGAGESISESTGAHSHPVFVGLGIGGAITFFKGLFKVLSG